MSKELKIDPKVTVSPKTDHFLLGSLSHIYFENFMTSDILSVK